MTTGKLIGVLFGCVGIGIVLGALVGLLLGSLSPGLIRLFLGDNASANSVGDGVALGLLNGGIYGFFGGIAVLIAVVMINRRKPD